MRQYASIFWMDEPSLSEKKFAEELHLDPSTVTRFVDALASRHLVHRDTSVSDQRSATRDPDPGLQSSSTNKIHMEIS